MAIHGWYGGAGLCRHYSRLEYDYSTYHRNPALPSNATPVVVWDAPQITLGPHCDGKQICIPWTGITTNPANDSKNWRNLSQQELIDMELTVKLHKRRIREYQAELADKLGFHGPIKGGEARALSRFLRSIGKEDCVRKLWIIRRLKRTKWAGTPYERTRVEGSLQGPVYTFRPFMEGFSFDDFMRVFRMMRPGAKDARTAIKEALANPTMKDDLEMLSAFDALGSLGGG